MISSLQKIFQRDLEKLKAEILLYQSESAIWETKGKIANSAGNLCLHLIGNLNCYIGAELGKTGYVRDRPLEFSAKNISRTELVSKIDETIIVVTKTLEQLPATALEDEYPLLVLDQKTTIGYFLIHLAVHLGYHLGQINYHRRLIEA